MIKAMQKRLMIIAILLLVICNKIAAADQVTISDFSIFTGQTKDVSISLANDKAYAAFQFDLVLPEGVTVVMPESPDTWNNHKSDRIPSTTDLSMQQLSDGSYRFVAMPGTTTIENISGSEGVIINLALSAAATAAVGNQTGYFRNIKLSASDGVAANGNTITEQSFTFNVRGDEAYAVLTDNGDELTINNSTVAGLTLTFYYDKEKDNRTGTIMPITTGEDPEWHNSCQTITKVVFDTSFGNYTGITSTADWFLAFNNLKSISGIEYLKTNNVTDMTNMFAGCYNLTELDVSGFNTANVKKMDHLFSACYGLTSIDVSNFNTSNVTSMNSMFYDCRNLTSIDVSLFNTGYVTDMGSLFNGCIKLSSINVSNFNTANVTDMSAMFSDCETLTSLDIRNFDTSNVTNMAVMFQNCSNLTSLDVSNFNTIKVENMSGMFNMCSKLTSIYVSNFNTANVTDMSSMFSECQALTSLDVSNFNTANVTDMYAMFKRCKSLTSHNISGFNTAKVTDMAEMFFQNSKLTSLDLGSFNTISLNVMHHMFNGSSELKTIYVGSEWTTENINTEVANYHGNPVGGGQYVFTGCPIVGGNGTVYDEEHTDYTYARIDDPANNMPGYFTNVIYKGVEDEPYAVLTDNSDVVTTDYDTTTGKTLTFYYDKKKTTRGGMGVGPFANSFGVEWYDNRQSISSVVFDDSFASYTALTSTAYWFDGFKNLSNISGISNLKTNSVTNMDNMFRECKSLTDIDLENFTTDEVTSMRMMFAGCSGLTTLDVRSFKTEKVEDFGGMFSQCSNLTTIDLSNFDTQNAVNIGYLFQNCTKIESLNFPKFNTSKVDDFSGLFWGCEGLTTLDLSDFNTSAATKMNYIFYYSSNLKTIYVSDSWTTANVVEGVQAFSGCANLVGGKGSTINDMPVDYTYARIDGGPNNPGYLTDVIYKDAVDEPYAVLTSNGDEITTSESTVNGKTLTFYYDKKKVAISDAITIVPFSNISEVGWIGSNDVITKVVFDDSFADCTSLTSTAYWFYGCTNLATITGIGNLKTENVTSMQSMFESCTSLTELDLTGFSTSKVTNMSRMFNSCSGLTSLDLSHFDVSSVLDMSSMFYDCRALTSINLSNWVTSKNTSMNMMFMKCSGLTELDLGSFNTASVTDMYHMFAHSYNLKTIYVGSGWTTSKVENGTEMFYGCSELVGGEGTLYSLAYTNYDYAVIDGGATAPGYLTNVKYKGVEDEAYAVLTDNVDEITTEEGSVHGKTLTFYYDKKKEERGGMSAMNYWEWDSYRESITQVIFDETMANCTSLTSTAGWFKDCSHLTTITGLVNLNTENVTEMQQMFQGCSSLTSLDLRSFNTQNVITMYNMFGGCSSLTNINLSSFNTSNVVYLGNMFRECSSLSTLDLSSFTTPKVTNIEAMFYECTNLTTIYVSSNWYTELITEGTNMFIGCQKLIGGRGAVFDANHTDYTYARIDGGSDNPGYFTDKYGVTLTAKDYTRKYGEANPTFEYTVEGAEFSGTPTITCTATTTSDAGTYPITITYDATGTGLNITCINGTLTITKAPLKVAAKSYTIKRGSAIPTFEVEYSGFVNNETNKVLTKKAVATCEAKSDTVPGTYQIIVSGAEAKNYEMEFVNGSLTITDDVVVTAKSYTREYGEANPKFEYTVDGAILEGTPAITCEATATSPVGTYDITIAKGDITNSDVTYVKGTLTITKAPLTITAKSYSIKQGKDLPTLELEYSGFKNNETDTVFTTKPTVTTRATSYSNPGTYDITVSGAEAANYEIKYVNGTLTITEKTETFDGNVLTVDEGGNIDDAFENMGGREEAAKNIAAIIWNASEPLTDDMLEGIDNPNLLVYVSDKKLAPEKVRNVVVDGVAKYISLTNDSTKNCNFYVPEEFKADSIVYTREFKQTTKKNVSRGWEGIVLPFTVQTFSHKTHGEIAPFGNTASKYHFWLHAITENGVIDATTIEANKPYIISMPNSEEYTAEFNQAGLVTFASADVKVPATETSDVWLNDSVVIIPTFQRVEKYDMVYALNVLYDFDDFKEGSVFVSNYRDVRPFEIYTFHENHHHKGAEARLFSVSSLFGGNGTTGIIDTMKTAEPNGEKWYDMNGHRLQGKPARKGVYILNGRKVVIK